jgi:hypothetical protein
MLSRLKLLMSFTLNQDGTLMPAMSIPMCGVAYVKNLSTYFRAFVGSFLGFCRNAHQTAHRMRHKVTAEVVGSDTVIRICTDEITCTQDQFTQLGREDIDRGCLPQAQQRRGLVVIAVDNDRATGNLMRRIGRPVLIHDVGAVLVDVPVLEVGVDSPYS